MSSPRTLHTYSTEISEEPYLRPIGNIRQSSLSELYYSTNAAGQRKTMITCNIDCQQTCKRKVPLLSKARAFLRMG